MTSNPGFQNQIFQRCRHGSVPKARFLTTQVFLDFFYRTALITAAGTKHRSQVIVLPILRQPKTMTCDLCFVPAVITVVFFNCHVFVEKKIRQSCICT